MSMLVASRCIVDAGSSRMGSALLLPFFATIGAAAGSLDALSDVGWLFCLIAIQLVTHLAIIICGGRLLKLPMDAILTASNANVGGPATAAATAAVRNWPHLVQPAVLTGTLGCVLHAIGTDAPLFTLLLQCQPATLKVIASMASIK